MRVLRSIFCLWILFLPLVAVSAQDHDRFLGKWEGELDLGGASLRLVFHVSEDAEKGMTAAMDSPDQMVMGIPMDSVVVTSDSTVYLGLTMLGAGYEAVLNADGQELAGEWNQMGITMPLTMHLSDEEPTVVRRPQTPEPPFLYRSEEVTFENVAAGVTLAGTLTIPSESAPSAVVILISGSGAQDRDSNVMDHRPFLVLADYLTLRGVAVLRYDDRGAGDSTGDNAQSTTEDFADDVLAAVSFLSSHPDVSGAHLGLVGHSEGGLVAPLVATQSEAVDFIVLMGAPGVVGEEIMMQQIMLGIEQAMRNQASMFEDSPPLETLMMWEQTEKMSRNQSQRTFDVLKTEADSLAAAEQMRDIMLENIPQEMWEDVKEMQDAQIGAMLTPWTRFFVTHDPAPVLEQVRCPVLVIGGEKDRQVVSSTNLPAIESALQKAGNQDVTILELEGLNHLFQTAETGYATEYGAIEETFAPHALEVIGDWIMERFSSP